MSLDTRQIPGDERRDGVRHYRLMVILIPPVALAGCMLPTGQGALERASVTPPPTLDEDSTRLSEAIPSPPSAREAGEPPHQIAPAPHAVAAVPPTSRTASAAAKRFRWARSDGQRISGNAELTAKAREDLVACKADAPPRVPTGAGGEACMKERGYHVRAAD